MECGFIYFKRITEINSHIDEMSFQNIPNSWFKVNAILYPPRTSAVVKCIRNGKCSAMPDIRSSKQLLESPPRIFQWMEAGRMVAHFMNILSSFSMLTMHPWSLHQPSWGEPFSQGSIIIMIKEKSMDGLQTSDFHITETRIKNLGCKWTFIALNRPTRIKASESMMVWLMEGKKAVWWGNLSGYGFIHNIQKNGLRSIILTRVIYIYIYINLCIKSDMTSFHLLS